ncbi:MAG: sugar phosphate nucleotidyltransferase [Acidobacteriota bacterium]
MPVTAVVPCAGYGTRMGELTESRPKELLPFGRRLVLDLVMEELLDGGCRNFFIIIRKGKESIRDHLLNAYGPKGYPRLDFEFVYQPEPLGLGDAYLQLKGLIREPFFAALPDHLVRGGVLTAMRQTYRRLTEEGRRPLMLKSEVVLSREEGRFSTGKAPGDDLGIRNTGRTIYPPEFLDGFDRSECRPTGCELTEVDMERPYMERHGDAVRCIRTESDVWDIGTLDGYRYYLDKLGRAEC